MRKSVHDRILQWAPLANNTTSDYTLYGDDVSVDNYFDGLAPGQRNWKWYYILSSN